MWVVLQIRTWLEMLHPRKPQVVQDLPPNARRVKGEVRPSDYTPSSLVGFWQLLD